jgi:hypothetical protein
MSVSRRIMVPRGRWRRVPWFMVAAFVIASWTVARTSAQRPYDAPTSGMVANGTSLTVTTSNAVATFSGLDLIGFVNSLTNERYLKKPSRGHLANVNAISTTGEAQQLSNWTMGTDPGTGLPLATITSRDSLRLQTLTVKIDPASQEIVLRSSASVTSPGVRGASWSIAGLDLDIGRWIIPAHSGVVFDRDHPGVNAFIKYPFPWQAQMAVYEAPRGSFLLYSTDTQHAFKQLRQSSRGDYSIDIAVYTEAAGPFASAATVPAVEWRLKAFPGDWRTAAQTFRDWMLANHSPVSNAAHPWVSNIQTVVMTGGQDTSVLAPLAAAVNPSRTLLYLIDWRQYGFTGLYPNYTPGPGAANFVAAAHARGFKVMLHVDSVGVDPNSPDYPSVQAYQARDPGTLALLGWNWDLPPNTSNRYAIISPASNAFRSLLLARVGAAINALGPDALHLDFNAAVNDGNGMIDGHTFIQGQILFADALIAAFPSLAISIEAANDVTYRYQSFGQAGYFGSPLGAGHPISTFLFAPQVLTYGHLATPNVSDSTFKSFLLQQQRRGVFPMWRVTSAADLDTSNADNARFMKMVQSFQSHAFQPAWTVDWTGALMRYQGLGGSTASLTDSGGQLTLTAAGSTLFRLVHDANRVVSGSVINGWPAYDDTMLYGLTPSQLYFLDPGARPVTTHATSLPSGVQLASATLVTPAFAHVEVAPALTSSLDFVGDLFKAHAGVRFQGIDYPLDYGAVVNPSTIVAGGTSRSGLFIHPPWQAQLGGEAFIEYSVTVPVGAALQFGVAVADNAACTDGVTFRVMVGGTEIWHQNVGRDGWHDVVRSLAAYTGSAVPLRLITNPGPAQNAGCDSSLWSGVALVAPTGGSAISVPIALAAGSAFSGFDGGGSFSLTTPAFGTVTDLAVPGAFTIFTQPGSSVTNGTNLATLPFNVWSRSHDGAFAQPVSVFNAGAVGAQTSGGVTKNSAIWAHPPNDSRTTLSWVIRLPTATPLKLDWSAGVIDGANSDDGVDFEVRINGQAYWGLTTGAHGDNHWTPGQLDLSRWQGQNILVEFVTDSRSNYISDWAAWADLVLSGSTVACSYVVPSEAAIGAFGGSFSASVTATATCPWSAASSVPWLTITEPAGSGNGMLQYVAASNSGPARIGTLTIAGQVLAVTQNGIGLPFADGALIARTSVIRAVHVTELRSRIDALRARHRLPAYPYSNQSIVARSSVVQVRDIIEMRQALQEVYAAAGLVLPAYSTAPAAGVTITVADIMDLRAAVVVIE